MSSIADLLRTAVELHRGGQLDSARGLYEQILASNPRQADALNLLGLLEGQSGDWPRASELVRQAIAIDDTQAPFFANLAAACRAQGQLAEAEAQYRRALELLPDEPELLHNLATLIHHCGRVDEAIALYTAVLRRNPEYVEAHFDLGRAWHESGGLDQSEVSYRRCLELKNNHLGALNNLATLLLNRGDWPQALATWQRGLEIAPQAAELHYNLGNGFRAQGSLPRAIACYRQAIALRADYFEAESNLGNALRDLGLPGEALYWLERAVLHNANFAPARGNLGAVLQDLGRLDDARRHFERAIALDLGEPKYQVNLGSVLKDQGFPAAAVACCDHVLRQHPGLADAQFLRGTACLSMGHFEPGWADYEARLRLSDFQIPKFSQPQWSGEPLKGRTLLVHCEQGLGDTLQFIRYLKPLKQSGGRLVVVVQKRLLPLLAGSGWEGLIAPGDPLPPFDVYSMLLSLPHKLGTTLETIPRDVPYLSADPARVNQWRAELRKQPGLKVGIAWQGRTSLHGDRLRSIPLRCFAPLAMPGVRLFSLQKGPGSEQLSQVADQLNVVDLGPALDHDGAFVDTAAVMRNLDVVITSDTAVAHLAGGLGVRVWLALSQVAEWRWMRQRDTSPWYPTMRLFRQQRLLDWSDVFSRLAAELQQLALSASPDLAIGSSPTDK
ncbi:MAG TPA: tetratricopeptide repeat protein [Pirellulales bacterium]|nr:tetratricopeptide repeat protein [Pirellulales bacterium]